MAHDPERPAQRRARRLEGAKQPTQPPAFDASRTWEVLGSELRQGEPFVEVDNQRVPVQQTGPPYQVFGDAAFPRWKRWVDGTAEFDGKGLRDVVDANAQYLDEVKGDIDQHKDVDNTRHAALRADLTALRAEVEALHGGPFPG